MNRLWQKSSPPVLKENPELWFWNWYFPFGFPPVESLILSLVQGLANFFQYWIKLILYALQAPLALCSTFFILVICLKHFKM